MEDAMKVLIVAAFLVGGFIFQVSRPTFGASDYELKLGDVASVERFDFERRGMAAPGRGSQFATTLHQNVC
jgi:hypothetical protein